jgi:hypothetical protein
MNPDKTYGNQCKDVIDDYVMAIFPGTSWVNTIRPGDAKVCFENSNPDYFEKIRYSPGLVPRRGDIIVWNGNLGAGAGHIAVIEGGSASAFDVIEQNGLWVKYDAAGKVIDPGKPAYRQHYSNYGNVIGILRPRLNDNQGEQDMLNNPDDVKDLYLTLLGRPAADSEAKSWTGKSWHDVYYGIKDSQEARDRHTAEAAKLNDLTTQGQSQVKLIDSLNKQLEIAEDERDSALEDVQTLQAKLDAQPPTATDQPPSVPQAEPKQPTDAEVGGLLSRLIAWINSKLNKDQ